MTNLTVPAIPVGDASLTSVVDDAPMTSVIGTELILKTVIDHIGGAIEARFLVLEDRSGYVLLESSGRIIIL